MNSAELIAALQLPGSALVDQRVPKKLLVENGAPTAADKRHITEGIEDIHWLAALKPSTIGVAEYRDETREYLEVAVLSATLRAGAKSSRLVELIHRAVPYPVFLILASDGGLSLSLAHKRWAQNEAGKVVLEGDINQIDMTETHASFTTHTHLDALALAAQPRTHLLALYQGWMDTLLAYQVACKTGRFLQAVSPEYANERRQFLRDNQELESRLIDLRAIACKERQLARQVELNLEIKRVQADLAAIQEQLTKGTSP